MIDKENEKTGEKIYINVDEGVKRVVNNTKLYVNLLKKFKLDTNFADLAAHLSAGDLEKARISAHTLKGLVAGLSLTELFEQTRNLESQIKEGTLRDDALDTIKGVYDETVKKVDEVIAKYAS
ncbi:MAG: Hpt domain-containing protein [Treponema sp.]|jgi:HPt (histidine-containing phosphotransfer) domain-containing protein|nr:Hpt domain-containing protein [Treponema sp.]